MPPSAAAARDALGERVDENDLRFPAQLRGPLRLVADPLAGLDDHEAAAPAAPGGCQSARDDVEPAGLQAFGQPPRQASVGLGRGQPTALLATADRDRR